MYRKPSTAINVCGLYAAVCASLRGYLLCVLVASLMGTGIKGILPDGANMATMIILFLPGFKSLLTLLTFNEVYPTLCSQLYPGKNTRCKDATSSGLRTSGTTMVNSLGRTALQRSDEDTPLPPSPPLRKVL